MRVVRTPVKKTPSNVRSRAKRARSHTSQSRPGGNPVIIQGQFRLAVMVELAGIGLGRRITSENGQKPSGWPIKYPGHASLDHRYEADASALSRLARRRGSFPRRSVRVWSRLLWAGDLPRGTQYASRLGHQP